jgi:hypothetical protein
MYQQNGSSYVKRIMESVFTLWKDGKIKPVVDSTWALEDVSCSENKLLQLFYLHFSLCGVERPLAEFIKCALF